MDNNMPIMTGLEAALKLKTMHENDEINLGNMKLVLVTGDEVDGKYADADFKEIIAQVFDDVMTKPLTKANFEKFLLRNRTVF